LRTLAGWAYGDGGLPRRRGVRLPVLRWTRKWGGCPHLEGLAAAPSEWGVGRSCPAAEDGGRTPGP
jgi:hypothetical protein